MIYEWPGPAEDALAPGSHLDSWYPQAVAAAYERLKRERP